MHTHMCVHESDFLSLLDVTRSQTSGFGYEVPCSQTDRFHLELYTFTCTVHVCYAQTSDLSVAWTVHGLAIYSPTHYFLCGMCNDGTSLLSSINKEGQEQIFNMRVGLHQINVQKCIY